ncbi:MAG: TRAP transporter small permease [Planctomycetes bacterium]|nr:TRAP transporter small permease [Planctomycetota bacterium]
MRDRGIVTAVRRAHDVGFGIVRLLTLVFAASSAAGVLAMMAITCVDVVGLQFRRPLTGALDLVQISMVFAVAGALPYTTAVKGHVALEYFFQKLSRRWRIIVDGIARVLGMALFAAMGYGCLLLRGATVAQTLGIPIGWLMWVIAFSCGLVVLVILYNLLHPGREMIKP